MHMFYDKFIYHVKKSDCRINFKQLTLGNFFFSFPSSYDRRERRNNLEAVLL